MLDELEEPVIDSRHPDLAGNKYGFEGGTVLKLDGTYHLLTAEMADDPFWVKMRLAYWHSEDARTWRRIRTLYETDGTSDPDNERFSLWAPIPIYNDKRGRWELFYVAYRPGRLEDNVDLHSEGKIWRATSVVPGRQGIGGPYEDVGIVLRPDQNAQSWEGQQGTDSFFPYFVDGTWYAFYGSHNHVPLGPWQVGLAQADALAGPWRRLATGNPCLFEPYFIENPIVTRVGSCLVVIYDSAPVKADLNMSEVADADHIGYSYSRNGVDWAPGLRVKLTPPGDRNWAEDVRTPLCLIDEGDHTYTMLYTARMKSQLFWALGWARLKLTGPGLAAGTAGEMAGRHTD